MRVILHVVRFKLMTILAHLVELKTENLLKQGATMIVFGGFMFGAYYSARGMTDYVLNDAKLGLFLLHRFLSMALFVFFLSVNVGNMIVSYATLYRSAETAYYLTTPLSHTNLFLIKFFDNFFYSSAAFFLIGFSTLLGYGSHFGMPWVFYAKTLLLLLFPFMLLSGCIAALLLLFLMRYAGMLGVRKLMTVLIGTYVGVLFGYFRIMNPLHFVAEVVRQFPHVDVYFGYLDPAISKFLPSHWISESLYWTMRGDNSYAQWYSTLLLFAAVFVFTIMIIIAKRLYYKSWLSSLELSLARETLPSPFAFMDMLRAPKANPQANVLVKKEFIQFFREPSQWIHLGIVAILVITFSVSVAGIDFKQPLPSYQTSSYLVLLMFSFFLITSIALRFVYPNMSIEGMSFWSILSAPVSRKRVFWIKFSIAFTPLLVLSELMVIYTHWSLQKYGAVIIAAVVMMVCCTFALVSLNHGAGTLFANYREKNPIRVSSSHGATFTFLLCLSYLVILVAILFFPLSGYFAYMIREIPFHMSVFWYGLGLVVFVSVLTGVLSLFVGYRAFQRDFK